MTERELNINSAKVYLWESRRRGRTGFSFLLLQWAANARRRAANAGNPQKELFA